ncbi:MAG: MerR family transcriptional regulator [Acidimicrobiales bacterium]|nr:MerR family transcriptional regulator [Acidimicrobiales bacterium]
MSLSLQVELRFKSMVDPGSVVMDISELSALTGLAPSALRFYERRGLITPIGRAGGKRIYRARTVQQIALIDLLKVSGFTLPEIAKLIDPDGHVSPDWRERARAKQEHLRRQLADIERALAMLQHTIECPHTSLHECPIHQAVVDAHADTLATSRDT